MGRVIPITDGFRCTTDYTSRSAIASELLRGRAPRADCLFGNAGLLLYCFRQTGILKPRHNGKPELIDSLARLKGVAQTRMNFGDHLRTTGGALKNWAVAQFLDSLAVAVLWLIGLYILHVPLAPMWALIAAVVQIVPHFGPVLGVLGPVIAATIRWMDWEHPLGVLGLYGVIALIDGLLLQPYIMRRTARVPLWASILAPIVLGVIWPFWGVLAAPPLLAVFYAYRARRKDSGTDSPQSRT
jgi:predicted PurR-regulated permease PerM